MAEVGAKSLLGGSLAIRKQWRGTAERLTATATVLGLFEEWESSLGDLQITGGDVPVIYADGITEANNADGEELGESRLLETIRRHLAAPVPLILDAILRATLEFSGGEGKTTDDLTWWSPGAESDLFVAQRHDWVNEHGTACGNVARQECN